MTKQQFDEIVFYLDIWRNERKLTKESQRKGYLGNVYEEVSEFYRATNTLDKIDAICDIGVFTLNAFDIDFDNIILRKIKNVNTLDRIIRTINQNDTTYMDYDYVLIRLLEEYAYACGFSFYHCMIEAINEISSRTGYYDTKINKFVKDKGAYALKEAKKHLSLAIKYKEDKDYWFFLTLRGRKKIKKWYKADYSKCLISIVG